MSTVLQPGLGPILGEHYLPARASEVRSFISKSVYHAAAQATDAGTERIGIR